jgi:hypothetical protein
MAWGVFNGTIFTCSYGFVNGSYNCYEKDISVSKYMRGIGKYIGKSWIYLTPFFTIGYIFQLF